MADFLCADWNQADWATDCSGPAPPTPTDTNRMGGTGAIRKPPRPVTR